tara:strand:+ start:1091 stop:1348 length:258 start_codon:yes stop_codon:yes gene_type:complete
MTTYEKNMMYCMELYSQFEIGDDVVVEWINNEYDFIRFIWGKIIDIDIEKPITKYKVEYINNLHRWETKLNKEWWYKKNLRKRIN